LKWLLRLWPVVLCQKQHARGAIKLSSRGQMLDVDAPMIRWLQTSHQIGLYVG
jgi:hypothetical protein